LEGRWGIRAALAGLGLLSLAGYALALRWLWGPGSLPLVRYVGLYAGLFVLYALAACLVLRRPSSDRVAIGIILAFGLLFRLAVLPSPVVLSSDLYRYLWDGRVQLAGINPYRYPPSAPELSPLRDPVIHPEINRPTKRTIYPPGAQATFTLMAAIAPNSVVAWRLFLFGCEVATAVLLLGLLRRMAVPATSVLLYAWAPLAVFEGVQAGHVDFVMLPALLLALLWRQEGHMARAGAALGVAVLLKLYPAVLLSAWCRRAEWRFPATCAAVVGAGYLPYAVGMGPGVLGFLPEYFGRVEDFNVGLRFFLTEGIGLRGEGERGIAMLLLFGILLAVLFRIGRGRSEDARGVFEAGLAAVAAYLVLVPTAMHPWYAVWILPFLTVRPSLAWLWFSGAVTLSYLTYNWGFPFWLRAVEFLPLYALLAWEWRRPGAGVGAPAGRGNDARLSESLSFDGKA
jgi:succinate dehydrogenase hydrophobic anchor subunit